MQVYKVTRGRFLTASQK